VQIWPQIVSPQFNSKSSIPVFKQFLKAVGIIWELCDAKVQGNEPWRSGNEWK